MNDSRFIILGGGGNVGRAIQYYLTDHQIKKDRIFSIDREWKDGVDCVRETYFMTLKEIGCTDIVISCLRPEKTLDFLNSFTRWNYPYVRGFIDLGGDDQITENVLAGDYLFPVVPDCGLAPGLVSSLAGWAARKGYKNVHIFCGGLPAVSVKEDYVRSFHTDGLLGEYFGIAKTIRRGEVYQTPTLSGLEAMEAYDAVFTSGGLSFTPEALAGKLNTLTYKTLRRAGHWDYLKSEILWRPDRKELIEAIYPVVSREKPDQIILIADIDNMPRLKYRWEFDNHTNLSAMAQATGYVVGEVAMMIDRGEVKKKGVVGMYDIPFPELIGKVLMNYQ